MIPVENTLIFIPGTQYIIVATNIAIDQVLPNLNRF
jgi:hypothetical protein